jgi:single-strand DNA-binding protein
MNMNHVSVVGRVAGDPKFTPASGDPKNGGTQARFFCRLAVNRIKSDKCDFLNVTIWGKQAEAAAQYVTKGKELGVTGSLSTNSVQREGGAYDNYWTITAHMVSYGHDSLKKQQADKAAAAAEPATPSSTVDALAAKLLAKLAAKSAPKLTPEQELLAKLVKAGMTKEQAEVAIAEELAEQNAGAAPSTESITSGEDVPF